MPQLEKKRILVIGAGVSGLCFALQVLTHASSFFTVTVFEKSPTPDPTAGFCIILSPNATAILRALQIDLVATGCAHPLTHTLLKSASGTTLLQSDNIFPSDPTSLLTVERGKLVALLLHRVLSAGGHVKWDHKLVSVSATTAVFSNSTTESGDIIVGADGVWSAVRRAVYHDENTWRPRPTRWTAVFGISPPLRGELLSQHGIMKLYLRRAQPGAYATYSLSGGRVFWICYESSPPDDARYSREEAEAALMGGFAGLRYGEGRFGDVVEKGSGDILKVRLFHHVFDKSCNEEENVVLIGDAAHPQTTFVGQGAGRGIEEGAELCRALLREAWSLRAEGHGRLVKREEVGVRFFVGEARKRNACVAALGWWSGAVVMGDWWWSRTVRDVGLWWMTRSGGKGSDMRVCKDGLMQRQQRMEQEEKVLRRAGKRKRQGNWLLDYRVPLETEVEFWEGIRAARELGRKSWWLWGP